MKRFLIEFMFVNCKNDRPTEALNKKKFKSDKKRRQDKTYTKSINEENLEPTNETKQDTVYSSKNGEGDWCKKGSKFSCRN